MTTTDLEAQQSQQEAEEAFAIERRVLQALADGREALWNLAEALYEFDVAHGWLKLNHENLSAWLADADVTITRATYYRLVGTWRKLVVNKQIEPSRIRQLDQSKVAIVADVIADNKVLVEDALADVETMPAQDLRIKYLGKAEPALPESGQNDTPDTSGHIEPDMDEPVPATEIEVAVEVVTGEVVDEDEFAPEPERDPTDVELAAIQVFGDLPGWVTPGAIEGLLADCKVACDSGAGFPRVSRQTAQVARELGRVTLAWLASQPT